MNLETVILLFKSFLEGEDFPTASNLTSSEEQVIALYIKGMCTREIQDHPYQLYDIEVSLAMISSVINNIGPLIKEWQNRPLQAVHAVVFLDAIHFKEKQDGAIVNKIAYMGHRNRDLDGNKGVIDMNKNFSRLSSHLDSHSLYAYSKKRC